MTFRIRGLDAEPFSVLYGLDDEALAARGVQRIRVDEPHSAPCRVTLEDVEPGEHVLLMSFEHQGADSPFRACGPIFVREGAGAARVALDEIPAPIARRTISARAYDRDAMMVEGELVDGSDLAALLETWLARPEVDRVHLHYARRGCFAAVAERA